MPSIDHISDIVEQLITRRTLEESEGGDFQPLVVDYFEYLDDSKILAVNTRPTRDIKLSGLNPTLQQLFIL